MCYDTYTSEYLIKSGGGTGPMKHGNLFFQGAKSGERIER